MEKGKSSTGKKIGITLGGIIVAGAIVAAVLYFTAMGNVRAKQHVTLGQKYLGEGAYFEAMAEFETALELDSRCTDAYIGLADAYEADLDVEMAILTLIEARKNCSSSEIEKRLSRLKEEHADEICDLTDDGIVYHEYSKPEYGRGPVCGKCGYEDTERKMSYFDEKEIAYYNHYLKEFMAHYVIWNSGDYRIHKIKQAPETVSVRLEHNGGGTKTYYITTSIALEDEPGMNSLFFSGGLADFYSGVRFHEKETTGDETYSSSQVFSYAGEEYQLDYTVSVYWRYVDANTTTCNVDYIVTCPEDYDGLVYVSKKISHWLTREQLDAESAAGIQTTETYVDETGMFNEFEKTGIFFRFRGDFEKSDKEEDEDEY